MAGAIKFQNGTLTNLIDNTGLSPNTLSALSPNKGAIQPSGNYFDNTVSGFFFADFELAVWPSAATVPAQNTTFDLYLLPSINCDGNFVDGSGGGPAPVPQNSYVGSFLLRTVPGPQRIYMRNIPIPPVQFLSMVFNNSNIITMPINSGAQVLRMLPYGEMYT